MLVGDVEGVQRNTSAKKKKNRRKLPRQVTQKLSQWQFGKLQEYLTYKLQARGIQIQQVDESYTTQTSPVCRRRKKVSGRVYKCKCGYQQHRDIHGASNILAKSLYGNIQLIVDKVQMKYLRVV
ncbi:zinc ribbon domain-containing protein [Effusibacillus consociatus]|uniref:Zinc ribbon domain-containing protein n=1 Tax=Effusibacillus consociatus TaxID=1117041 RepID=A0ABV9PYE7_9BACL